MTHNRPINAGRSYRSLPVLLIQFPPPMSEIQLDLPSDIPEEEARRLFYMTLFQKGRLSLGKAAELSGYSKRTFMELLGKEGIPVFNYSGDDLEKEFEGRTGPDSTTREE